MTGFSSAPTSTGSAVSPEPSCPGLKQVPQRNSQPSAQESLVLHERGVIDSAWLRQQLGLDGKTAARTTAKTD
jgi:hypothetical protein